MRKALVLGVALVTLVGLSGMAQGTWLLKYRVNGGTYGWVDYGDVGQYFLTYRLHEVDNAIWIDGGSFNSAASFAGHDMETWQLQYDTKTFEDGKLVGWLHYTRHVVDMVSYNTGSDHYMGWYRVVWKSPAFWFGVLEDGGMIGGPLDQIPTGDVLLKMPLLDNMHVVSGEHITSMTL